MTPYGYDKPLEAYGKPFISDVKPGKKFIKRVEKDLPLNSNNLSIALKLYNNLNEVVEFSEKFEAFGFKVTECDGHDFAAIAKAFEVFHNTKGQPTCIIAHTTKGKGVSFMENNAAWHGSAPNDEQYKIAMNDLKEVK